MHVCTLVVPAGEKSCALVQTKFECFVRASHALNAQGARTHVCIAAAIAAVSAVAIAVVSAADIAGGSAADRCSERAPDIALCGWSCARRRVP